MKLFALILPFAWIACRSDPITKTALPPGGALAGIERNGAFWAIFRHAPTDEEKTLLGKSCEGERLTLCRLRFVADAGITRLQIIVARDVSLNFTGLRVDEETITSMKNLKRAYERAIND